MFFVEAEDISDFDKIFSKGSIEMEEFVPYEAAKLLNNKWVLCLVSKEMKRDIHAFLNSKPNDNSSFEYITLESMDLTKSSDMKGYLRVPDESLNSKIKELTQNKGWVPLGSVMYMIDTVWYKGQPRYVQPFFRIISKTQQEEDKKAKEEKERQAKEEKERQAKEEKERREINEQRKKAWEEQQKKAREEAYAKIPVVKDCPSYGKEPVPCDDMNPYRKQALLFHPDKNSSCASDAKTKFQKLENIPECIKAKNTVASGGKSKRKKMILNKNKSIKNKNN